MYPEVKPFFDPNTSTLTYVVFDGKSHDAVVIDPVLDYNSIGSSVSDESYQRTVDFIAEKGLKLHFIMETHAHADHLSSSQLFRNEFPDVEVVISERIQEIQKVFKGVYNLSDAFATDGRQFDRLIEDFEIFHAGTLTIKALPTPGHTPACLSFLIGDTVFTGDALFMPDYGTGRCDFPAGDATKLYRSVTENLYSLPESTRVFVGHDYQPGGREVAWESNIGEEKTRNIQLNAQTSEADFVAFRQRRDATLKAPKLLYQSILVNLEAGHLPTKERNGQRYLKIPLNIKTGRIR